MFVFNTEFNNNKNGSSNNDLYNTSNVPGTVLTALQRSIHLILTINLGERANIIITSEVR